MGSKKKETIGLYILLFSTVADKQGKVSFVYWLTYFDLAL